MPEEAASVMNRLSGVTGPKGSQRLSDTAARGQVGDYREVKEKIDFTTGASPR